MISSKEDMNYYIQCDLKSLNKYPLRFRDHIESLICPTIWKFEIKLRKTEYYLNCKANGRFTKLIALYKKKRTENYGRKLGYTIMPNTIGPGLCLCHRGTVIINGGGKHRF